MLLHCAHAATRRAAGLPVTDDHIRLRLRLSAMRISILASVQWREVCHGRSDPHSDPPAASLGTVAWRACGGAIGDHNGRRYHDEVLTPDVYFVAGEGARPLGTSGLSLSILFLAATASSGIAMNHHCIRSVAPGPKRTCTGRGSVSPGRGLVPPGLGPTTLVRPLCAPSLARAAASSCSCSLARRPRWRRRCSV